MKQYTLSIVPEKFEEQIKKQLTSYFEVSTANELKKLDIMTVFREYLENFHTEIIIYAAKYPEKQERFNEYMTRYEILLRVFNKYSTFYYDCKNSKLENIQLKVKLHESNLKVLELQKELDQVKKEKEDVLESLIKLDPKLGYNNNL
jgi:hypothetical protein